MEPAAATPATPAAPMRTVEHESLALRTRRLAAARRRATAVLAGVTVLFIAVSMASRDLPRLRAGRRRGVHRQRRGRLVAVTALFRHPLGLPIPYTALIVERKDQFTATLGQFVQENFLNADVLADRIRAAGLVPQLAGSLSDQASAARFSGYAADLVVTVAEALRDEDVQQMLTAELTRVVDSVELAPLAGRALRVVIAEGQHAELFNVILAAADRYLGDHSAELREVFEGEAPRWIPDAVYRRVFDRLYSRLRERLTAIATDPDDTVPAPVRRVDRRAPRPPGNLAGPA